MLRTLLLPLTVVLWVAPVAAQDAAPPAFTPFTPAEAARYTELGQRVTRWFFQGHADSILAVSSAETVSQVGGLDGMRAQMDRIAERAGVPLRVLAERMTRRNGVPQFWWEAEMSAYTAEPIVLRWLFNEQGQLVGAGVSPRSQAASDPEG